MAKAPERSADDQMLLGYLAAQRAVVLDIVEGLSEEDWHRPIFPSGWNVGGMVEHLGGAEWHWFEGVVSGHEPPPLEEGQEPYDPYAPFITDEPPSESINWYKSQCARSDEILAGVSLSDPPKGKHGDGEEPPNVRWIVLHMIEETARHAGHLDVARELIDGKTRLGMR